MDRNKRRNAMDRNNPNNIAKQKHLQLQRQIIDTKLDKDASMQDTLGRTVKVGQIVDIPLNGMYRGYVVAVVDNVIAKPGQPPHPPHVLVQVNIPKTVMNQQGDIPFLYVVQDVQDVRPQPTQETSEGAGEGANAPAVGEPAAVPDPEPTPEPSAIIIP